MKKIICILVIISLSVINVYALFNQNKSQKIRIYGEDMIISKSYIDSDGTIYLPVRELFERKGDIVIWREDDQTVEICERDNVDVSSNFRDTAQENFEKYLQMSEEGIIQNGQKYKYIAPCDYIDPTYEMDYEQYFKDYGMVGGNNFILGVVPDAKTAVEIAKDILKLEYNEKISYNVMYDFKHGAWVVVENFNGNIFSRGPKGIVIRKYDGRVLSTYGDGLTTE